jgi:O-antigen/teichoic acid export membrane protein
LPTQSSTSIDRTLPPKKQALSEATRTGHFLGNVLLISGGTVAAQALAAASAPVITRLFSPAEFGILGTYTAFLAVLSSGITFRYEWAIPLAESEVEAVNVFALSIGIATLNSVLLGVALLVLRPWLPIAISACVLWLPVGVLAVALYRALSILAIRKHEYRKLAATKITQTASMLGIQIGSGLLRVGAAGLLLGQIAGQAGGSGTLARRMLISGEWLRSISLKETWRVARKFARFPKFSAAAALLNSCSEALPVLCLIWMFGPVVTGYYTLMQRLIFVPGSAVVSSVSQVFFGESCHLQRESRPDLIRRNYIHRFWQLLLLGVSGAVIGAIIAPRAVPTLFGAKWQQAGLCVQIFSPVLATWLPASSLSVVLDALQRQDLHLKREILKILVVLGGLGISYVCATTWVQTFIIISVAYTIDMILYSALSWQSMSVAKPST